ncbi:MAG: hypothetical protein ACPG8W_20615, partial [Candidatus Promineifilaceae bacterium]
MNNNSNSNGLLGCAHSISAGVGFILLMFALLGLAAWLVPTPHGPWSIVLVTPFIILMPLLIFMSSPIGYSLIMVGGGGLLLCALLFSQTRWYWRLVHLLTFGGILLATFYPYQPIEPKDPYTLLMPTQSAAFWNGLWRIQSMSDDKPCRYQLLGWDSEPALYYETTCDSQAAKRIWRFDPAQNSKHEVENSPFDLLANPTPITSAQHLFKLEPTGGIPGQFHLWLYDEGFYSAEQTYFAAVSKNL